MTDQETTALIETRLVHNVHRRASSLLAEAATRPCASSAALAEVRDFLIAQLRHHHETEDDLLWPMITAEAPEIATLFAGLSGEHDKLDAALDALAAVQVDNPDRAALIDAAVALRDLVHTRLEHEEPVLFPALRDHVSEQTWQEFAEQVKSTMPDVGTHLAIGFLDQVDTPDEVAIIFGDIPTSIHAAMREQANATLSQLADRPLREQESTV